MIHATAARYRMLIKSDHGIYPVRHISSSSSSYANITSRPYAQRLPLHLRFVAIIISAERPRLLTPSSRFARQVLHYLPPLRSCNLKRRFQNKCKQMCDSDLNINGYHASYVKMHIRIICHACVTSKELV